MKRDPVNEKLDAMRRSIERCLLDLKIARGGDRSLDRLSLIQKALYEAGDQLRHVIDDDLDLFQRRKKPPNDGLPLTKLGRWS